MLLSKHISTTVIFLIFCIVSQAVCNNYNVMKFNSIRIAYYEVGEDIGNGSVDTLLIRAKNAKYNYILAEFKMYRGNYKTLQEKRKEFRNAFKKIDSFGMRMIPLIQLGSCWSSHWLHAKKYWNKNLEIKS